MDPAIAVLLAVGMLVLGVVILRLIRRGTGRRSSSRASETTNVAPLPVPAKIEAPPTPAAAPPSTVAVQDAVVLGDFAHPDVTFYPAGALEGCETRSLDDSVLGRAAASIPQALVGLGMLREAVRGRYIVRFSAATRARLLDGTYDFMRDSVGRVHAIAVDAHTRTIAEHGVIETAGRLAPALAAIWQGLAVITAQKFLSDIDNKLQTIERKLDSIKKWLEDNYYGRLTGRLSYLGDLAARVQAGEDSQEVRNTVESYNAKSTEASESLWNLTRTARQDLEVALSAITAEPVSRNFLKMAWRWGTNPGLRARDRIESACAALAEWDKPLRAQELQIPTKYRISALRLVLRRDRAAWSTELEAIRRLAFSCAEERRRVGALIRSALDKLDIGWLRREKTLRSYCRELEDAVSAPSATDPDQFEVADLAEAPREAAVLVITIADDGVGVEEVLALPPSRASEPLPWFDTTRVLQRQTIANASGTDRVVPSISPS